LKESLFKDMSLLSQDQFFNNLEEILKQIDAIENTDVSNGDDEFAISSMILYLLFLYKLIGLKLNKEIKYNTYLALKFNLKKQKQFKKKR